MTSVLAAHAAATLAFFHVLSLRSRGFELGGLVVSVPAVQTLCLLVLVGSVVVGLSREWAKRCVRLMLVDDGTLVCETPKGTWHYRLEDGAADFGWAVWLRFRPDDGEPASVVPARSGGWSIMLVRANLRPGDSWGGLRIWLRHKAYSRPLA